MLNNAQIDRLEILIKPFHTDAEASSIASRLANLIAAAPNLLGTTNASLHDKIRLIPPSADELRSLRFHDPLISADLFLSEKAYPQNQRITREQFGVIEEIGAAVSHLLGDCHVAVGAPFYYITVATEGTKTPSPLPEHKAKADRAAACLVSHFRNAPGNRGYGYNC